MTPPTMATGTQFGKSNPCRALYRLGLISHGNGALLQGIKTCLCGILGALGLMSLLAVPVWLAYGCMIDPFDISILFSDNGVGTKELLWPISSLSHFQWIAKVFLDLQLIVLCGFLYWLATNPQTMGFIQSKMAISPTQSRGLNLFFKGSVLALLMKLWLPVGYGEEESEEVWRIPIEGWVGVTPCTVNLIPAFLFGIASVVPVETYGGGNLQEKGNVTDKPFACEKLHASGLYKYVRHPTYLFRLLMCVSGFMVTIDRIILAMGMLLYIYILEIPTEENQLLGKFGKSYELYRQEVPAILPKHIQCCLMTLGIERRIRLLIHQIPSRAELMQIFQSMAATHESVLDWVKTGLCCTVAIPSLISIALLPVWLANGCKIDPFNFLLGDTNPKQLMWPMSPLENFKPLSKAFFNMQIVLFYGLYRCLMSMPQVRVLVKRKLGISTMHYCGLVLFVEGSLLSLLMKLWVPLSYKKRRDLLHVSTATLVGVPADFVNLILAILFGLASVIPIEKYGGGSLTESTKADDKEALAFGNLRASGLFKYVRHPYQVFRLLMCFCGVTISKDALVLTVGMLLYMCILEIPIEEKQLIEKFGTSYELYRQQVPTIVPKKLHCIVVTRHGIELRGKLHLIVHKVSGRLPFRCNQNMRRLLCINSGKKSSQGGTMENLNGNTP